MKKVALHDSDKTSFPNLALMKISAWHKSQGDIVGWFDPFFRNDFDIVYSSKVFNFTPEDPYLPDDTIKGGIGYGSLNKLPDNIEHCCPDYTLYDIDYSLGFTTRGCIRNCSWCFVPEKEGGIKVNADISEFLKHEKLVLMDNNILAHRHGIEQLEKIADIGIKLDCNQGIDARLINKNVAKLFSRIKWFNPVRLACDTVDQIESVFNAVKLLRWHNVTPRRYSCYVIVDDVREAREIVYFLKGIDVDPHCQPLRDKIGTPPTQEQKNFARWTDMKSTYKTTTWEQYNKT